jgi:hypothetical protein
MYKLLKWIYELGYRNGRQDVYDEQERQRFDQELFDRITKDKR